MTNNGRFIVQRWMFWAGVVGIVAVLAFAAYLFWDRRKYDGIEGRHEDAKADFREAETVYVAERTRLVRFADTLRITDTVQVREFVRACSSALTACDSAMARAKTAIATGDSVIKHLKRGPFMESYGVALYDPVAKVPTARVGLALKPRSRISLMVEGEQRFEPGASPRVNAGLRVRF
jgi:hypothetical protein